MCAFLSLSPVCCLRIVWQCLHNYVKRLQQVWLDRTNEKKNIKIKSNNNLLEDAFTNARVGDVYTPRVKILTN